MYESMRGFPSSLFGELDRLQLEWGDMFGFSGRPASIRSVAPGSYPAINIGNTPTSARIRMIRRIVPMLMGDLFGKRYEKRC